MPLPSEHKALAFFAGVAILGAGVRVVRAAARESAPRVQPALERQAQSADSAARAGRAAQAGRGATKPKARRTTKGVSADSTQRAGPVPRPPVSHPPLLDRPGYIAGKLDVDVASLAQLDSLPGVSAAMAKRIVLDRRARGPFVTPDGLRRVSGVGPTFLRKLDSLVVFSGTVLQPSPADTMAARPPPRRTKRAPRPLR